MARRPRPVPEPWVDPPPDTRPHGTVRFADPSTATMTKSVVTFNDPHSPGLKGEGMGIRSINDDVRGYRIFGYDGADGVREMNRKRGVGDEGE